MPEFIEAQRDLLRGLDSAAATVHVGVDAEEASPISRKWSRGSREPALDRGGKRLTRPRLISLEGCQQERRCVHGFREPRNGNLSV